MELITKKVSFLKGLAEGYKLDAEKDDMHNLILGIIDCLDLMADEINFLDSDFQRLEEYIDMVDEDLSELEMIFDDDMDDDDYIYDDDDNNNDWIYDWDEDEDEDEDEDDK